MGMAASAMLEETADILIQDRIWVNAFDRRCRKVAGSIPAGQPLTKAREDG
jgi:hypothetical protein